MRRLFDPFPRNIVSPITPRKFPPRCGHSSVYVIPIGSAGEYMAETLRYPDNPAASRRGFSVSELLGSEVPSPTGAWLLR